MSSEQQEVICGYRVHPFASNFAPLEGQDFDELVEDIRQNGLQKPIKVDDSDQIVDGRNRLRACDKAGVAPIFEPVPDGEDVQALIIRENVLRRHLTVSQRALIAAEIVTTTIGKPPKDSKAISSTAAAERLNVSRSSVSEARAIKKHGSPELVKAVADGRIDIRSAGKVARESAEKQKEVVAQAATEPAPRKQNDAQFNRQKWRDRVEKVYSSALAKAPADMQDWARGTFRDVCGGSLRKEATLNIPDGDDVTMYDAEDVIARIEGMLKEIPISERKDIKQAVGKHFIGQKPEQYLPELSAEETDADRVAVVVGELKNRQKQMESLEDVSKVLKQAISGLRRIVKAESDASE